MSDLDWLMRVEEKYRLNQAIRDLRSAGYGGLVTRILEDCSQWVPDRSSSYYGTAMYGRHCKGEVPGLYVTYRPVRFREGGAVMLHALEADEPGSGAWRGFWEEFHSRGSEFFQAGFRYCIIDCILEPRFERHILNRGWGLVLPGELLDPSTQFSTYCFDLGR